MKPSFLLGVDILEWKKARSFYRAHGERLGAWLSEAERDFVETKTKPHEAFAMIFAAKEAVLKALGAQTVGPDALRSIRLVPRRAGKFGVIGRSRLEVRIRRHQKHVVACCQSKQS
jgi:phosphopantetheine--protein transferase-like protein